MSAHSGGDVPGRGYIGSHSERAASSPAETTDVLQMARYLGMDPSEVKLVDFPFAATAVS